MDLGRRERFDALFGGLWIHAHPTAEQGRYLVLTLDFSSVATDGGEELLRRSFLDAVRARVATFLLRYSDRIPVLVDLYSRLDNFANAEGLIGTVLDVVAATPYKMYLLIDEYDQFAGRLAAGEGSMYETIVKKTGFVRTFYATLKSGTQSGAVARIFVTGVSPHIDVSQLREAIGAMAIRGEIEPFLNVFHTQVLQAFSNRDMRGLDEKTIKLLLMTYVSLGRAYYPLSEREFAQGYGDLFLAVSRNVAGANFSWLLEFKYLKAGAKPAQIEAAFVQAEAQVSQYSTDPALLPHLLGDKQLKAGMLVFVGAKKVLFRPWQRRDCVPSGCRSRGRSRSRRSRRSRRAGADSSPPRAGKRPL